MWLIGMLDSPFVRRVAITLQVLDLPFDHASWSVGKDFDRIREHNPLGRVPTLVLGDGEALVDSGAILDYLDELVGPERALVPPSGPERRQALRRMAVASGAAEKGVAQLYERAFRPEAKRHEPWLERCRAQVAAGLAELERGLQQQAAAPASLGSRMGQAEITTACVFTFLNDAGLVPNAAVSLPLLSALVARCEATAPFLATRTAFVAPST